jgi:hypothetical protein
MRGLWEVLVHHHLIPLCNFLLVLGDCSARPDCLVESPPRVSEVCISTSGVATFAYSACVVLYSSWIRLYQTPLLNALGSSRSASSNLRKLNICQRFPSWDQHCNRATKLAIRWNVLSRSILSPIDSYRSKSFLSCLIGKAAGHKRGPNFEMEVDPTNFVLMASGPLMCRLTSHNLTRSGFHKKWRRGHWSCKRVAKSFRYRMLPPPSDAPCRRR